LPAISGPAFRQTSQDNGKVIFISKSYTSKQDAETGIESVKMNEQDNLWICQYFLHLQSLIQTNIDCHCFYVFQLKCVKYGQ
jgi:hypothetical protein